MSYSRRQLYAMGEPLGDSATYRKVDGGLVLGGGGGGGGTGSQTTTTDLPDWAKPYAKNALEKGAALSETPYQKYDQNRFAGFSPMQLEAQKGAANMQTSGATGAGINAASLATLGALGTNYQGGGYGNQFQAPGAYEPGQFNANQVENQGLNQYQMRGPQQVRSQNFGNQAAEDYMSPYMQNVVDIQQREAQRQADIAGTGRGAQAAKMGAFGGSRQAVMEAEAARNLATQKGDIQATGQQAAFTNAQQQFNADQARRMQAQQANQQAGLTAGQANLNALLGVQSLGAGQNLQAQLANQQYGLQAQQLGEQSRQFGAGQGLSAAQAAAQYGQAANQLNEQSNQSGAGLGLQGLQTALTGAGQLGTLGGQQFGQGMDINKLQNAYGGQQQALRQQGMDAAYQEFLNEQNYPYKQLGFMSDLIRGLPLGQQSNRSMYEAPGSLTGQIAGLGMGAYGLSQMMPKKDGGMVNSYAEGGSVDSAMNVASILSKLSDEQLQQAKQSAMNRRDVEQANLIDQEIAQRASLRNGINASPVNADEMASDQNPESISSFAKGGSAVEEYLAQPKEAEVPTEEVALGLLDKLGARSKPAMDALNAQIESQKGRGDEIKGRGFNEALAQYGFKMAQAASKPGARFMNAASEASPVLAESAINTNKAVQAAQDNYTKLKMDQQKLQIALDKGDMPTATALIGQVRQDKQATKTLGLQGAHFIDQFNNQKAQIAASAAGREAPFLQVVNDLAGDPRNKDKSREELMSIASKAMYGAQYNKNDAYLAQKIQEDIKADPIIGSLRPFLLGAKTPEEKQKVMDKIAEREAQIESDVMRRAGMRGGDSSGSISSALPKEGKQGGQSGVTSMQKSDLDLINKYSR